MLLGRLRIRSRLALLILVPLVAALALTVANAVSISQQAARAGDTATRVQAASQVAVLVRSMQRERLTSVGLLLGLVPRSDVLQAIASTKDAIAAAHELGLPELDSAMEDLAALDKVRGGVMVGAIRPADVVTTYSLLATSVLDSVRLLDMVDGDTAQGKGAIALDAILKANEGFAAVAAALLAGGTPSIETPYTTGLDLLIQNAQRYVLYATPDQVAMYGIAQVAVDARLGKEFNEAIVSAPGTALRLLEHPPSYAAVVSLGGIGQYMETKVINDTVATANDAVRLGETRVEVFVGLSLLLILVAILLGTAVARSVANPVRRLTRSAENVARLAESELVRVADDESGEAEPVRLQPIEVSGRDELADFARAFGRVQETAARLVERQVASRRNVAQMFGHVGRRTQNLVGRQISLIDRLESQETEPDRLGDLYRLDHISSRLRRNASSLVVLSGAGDADEHVVPLPLERVVRLGLAEIEDYTRVDVGIPESVHVVPALINDLVLLLAELMENATVFSPPGTRVVVMGVPSPDGLRLSVIDHGLGMTPDQLADENTRLTRRERLDLAPTEVLGLFVVGRLARRHGLTIVLAETPGGGVTASVDVPARLLTENVAVSLVPMRPVGTGLATVAHSSRELDLLGRASLTVRQVQPWNAFALASRPARTADSWPTPVVARERASIEPRPMYPVGAGSASAIPSQRAAPASGPARSPSTLGRRVPGAGLTEFGADALTRAVAYAAPSSAEEVRDSLAQFESGIARANREAQQGDAP